MSLEPLGTFGILIQGGGHNHKIVATGNEAIFKVAATRDETIPTEEDKVQVRRGVI